MKKRSLSSNIVIMRPVIAANKSDRIPEEIIDISKRLEIPIVESLDEQDGHLFYKAGKLKYGSETLNKGNQRAIYFDFIKYWNYHQTQRYSIKKEPFAKAIFGKKSAKDTKVWDLTCGTGKDSILMLFWGATVVAFERSPFIAALLLDAINRARENDKISKVLESRFKLYLNDPRDEIHIEKDVDTIFLDPMYSDNKKRKALPRKEMQIFKEVVGRDIDAKDLLDWALLQKCERVVVKRGIKADPLDQNQEIVTSFKGKSTRYDLYNSRSANSHS